MYHCPWAGLQTGRAIEGRLCPFLQTEWKEFSDYTGTVHYTVANKQDTTYLGRFTFDTLMDFEGLARVLTILARGFLFHEPDGSLAAQPRVRIEYARGVCAPGAVFRTRKKPPPKRHGSSEQISEGFTESSLGWWTGKAVVGSITMYMR